MGTIIKVDGTLRNAEPKNGLTFELPELKKHIGGGYLELVTLDAEDVMWIDEDGKRKGLPVNRLATLLAKHVLHAGDVIVGQAFICKRGEVE